MDNNNVHFSDASHRLTATTYGSSHGNHIGMDIDCGGRQRWRTASAQFAFLNCTSYYRLRYTLILRGLFPLKIARLSDLDANSFQTNTAHVCRAFIVERLCRGNHTCLLDGEPCIRRSQPNVRRTNEVDPCSHASRMDGRNHWLINTDRGEAGAKDTCHRPGSGRRVCHT